MDTERALRRLASNITDTIRAQPDVLHGRTVDVPSLSGARFDPAGLEGPELPLPAPSYRWHLVSSFSSSASR